MLDANLVLEDVETLLHEHYSELSVQMQSRVRVYETPTQPIAAQQTAPPVPQPTNPPNPLNQFVANVFVLVMLSLLENKLSNQPAR